MLHCVGFIELLGYQTLGAFPVNVLRCYLLDAFEDIDELSFEVRAGKGKKPLGCLFIRADGVSLPQHNTIKHVTWTSSENKRTRQNLYIGSAAINLSKRADGVFLLGAFPPLYGYWWPYSVSTLGGC